MSPRPRHSATRAKAAPETAPPRLTRRELNRATLARQMLLARDTVGVGEALHRLGGLQAQWPAPPHVGLWTRLAGFARTDLAGAIEARTVVRAPLLRGTLHVVTAADFLHLRPVLQPVLDRAFAGLGDRTDGIDPHRLAAEARPFLAAAPRTQDEVRNFLVARHPKLDERAMGHAVRLTLPLIQVLGAGSWGFPSAPQFVPVEIWLGRPLAKSAGPEALALRYLAAFGPAAPRDFQVWSGLQNAAATFAALRSRLRVFVDDEGREIFDLPDAPRPSGSTPAPPRFMAEYDNLLLAHSDRSRVVPDEFRKKVFLAGLRVAPTFLVDGFVRGSWKIARARQAVTLSIEPFAPLTKKDRTALQVEAAKLVRFVAFDADPERCMVRFVS